MFEQTFKNIDDILHKDAGCGSELDYVEQTSWVLFLKYLEDLERDKQTAAQLSGRSCPTWLTCLFFAHIDNPKLIDHINREGKVFYQRQKLAGRVKLATFPRTRSHHRHQGA